MSDEYGDYMDSRAGAAKMEWSGCCIRFSDRWGTPAIHANSQHIAVGVKSISINSDGNLEIKHEGGPIVAMFASPDETIVGKNIQVGLSGGGGTTVAKFWDGELGRYLDLGLGRDWLRIHGAWSNLWLGWLQVTGGRS